MNGEVRKARNRAGYNGMVGKATCRQCGRPETVVLSTFTLGPHGSPACPGPQCRFGCRPCCPELVFTDLLHAAGLCVGQQR